MAYSSGHEKYYNSLRGSSFPSKLLSGTFRVVPVPYIPLLTNVSTKFYAIISLQPSPHIHGADNFPNYSSAIG